MAFGPENSAIKITGSLEELISAAQSQAEVQAILREAAKSQGVVRPDAFDPNVLHEVEAVPQPKGYAKAIVINGVTAIVEGRTEQELTVAETALYRAALSQPTPVTAPVEQPRNERGQFTAPSVTA